MIDFVGAGPGAIDLITVRGKKLIEEADIIIYAGSLINHQLLDYARSNAKLFDSSKLNLEEIMDIMINNQDKRIVRLHSGDPSIYGAIEEQMRLLDQLNIEYAVCPGVSSMSAAAAVLKKEYTPAEVSQTIIISRMSGRTKVPEAESIEKLASHNATMILFLSASLLKELEMALIKGGYDPLTKAAIIYKASWPEEKIYYCPLNKLAETGRINNITKTALIVVGKFLEESGTKSKLYDKDFSTMYRNAK